jgi:hypothetical protein
VRVACFFKIPKLILEDQYHLFMIDFQENLYRESFSFKETKELRPPMALADSDIPTSKQISGIEIRLSRVHIRDNKTPTVGPFPGLAKVYLMNLVVSNLMKSEVDLSLNGFEKVDDNHTLAVDRTLFYWKKVPGSTKPPAQIHIMSSLIKSKKALRDTAGVMASAKGDERFKKLTTDLTDLLKSASNISNISNIILELGSIVGSLLGKVEDKPLLTRFQSFTDIAGDFNQLGKTELPFANKYANLDYSIYIRDKEREDALG